jgi:hypothetical protein
VATLGAQHTYWYGQVDQEDQGDRVLGDERARSKSKEVVVWQQQHSARQFLVLSGLTDHGFEFAKGAFMIP